nr:uncharacterized protein LOC106690373 [Halyomorpha halys]
MCSILYKPMKLLERFKNTILRKKQWGVWVPEKLRPSLIVKEPRIVDRRVMADTKFIIKVKDGTLYIKKRNSVKKPIAVSLKPIDKTTTVSSTLLNVLNVKKYFPCTEMKTKTVVKNPIPMSLKSFEKSTRKPTTSRKNIATERQNIVKKTKNSNLTSASLAPVKNTNNS